MPSNPLDAEHRPPQWRDTETTLSPRRKVMLLGLGAFAAISVIAMVVFPAYWVSILALLVAAPFWGLAGCVCLRTNTEQGQALSMAAWLPALWLTALAYGFFGLSMPSPDAPLTSAPPSCTSSQKS